MPELDLPMYLKGEELKAGITATILDGGRIRSKEDTGFKEDVLEIEIELSNHERRTWSLNKTSYINLADIYGKNSDTWVGKRVRFETSSQKVGKEMKTVIYGWAETGVEEDCAKAKADLESSEAPETSTPA